jgi:fructokinase
MKRQIFGIGEVVYDIIFKNEKPVEARPGGAILNMLVSLARLGMPVTIIADMVEDKTGKIIYNFLKENNLDCSRIYWHKQGRSRLALAFLNDHSDADYVFYKMQHEEPPNFQFPKTCADDMLIFGSYYAIKPLIRQRIEPFLEECYRQKSWLLYDPNFRKSHVNMLNEVRPFIEKNIMLASLVKASHEDCSLIFGLESPNEIYRKICSCGGKYLVLTQAEKDVLLFTPKFTMTFPVSSINPVSTIGAGDAFMSGLAYGFYRLHVGSENLPELSKEVWSKIINTAILCSSQVCMTYENYLLPEKVNEIKNFLQ